MKITIDTYIFCIYLYIMKRYSLFFDNETLQKLKDKKSEYGIRSVSGFIRFIINQFLKNNQL